MTEKEQQFNKWFDEYANGVKVFEEADMKQAYLQGRAELEKENAELKVNYEVLSCSVGDFGELQDKLEEEQRKNNGLSDNLTKAKELLKRWVELSKPKLEGYPIPPIQEQTEQFLKKLEK